MSILAVEIVSLLFYLHHAASEGLLDAALPQKIENGRILHMSIHGEKNQSGNWVDTFIAKAEFSNFSHEIKLDLLHSTFDVDGKRIIYIKGVSNEDPQKTTPKKIHFHKRSGKNIAVVDGGNSVQKINVDDPNNSVIFTAKPLMDNEVFELRLDKRNPKFTACLGIGITTGNPDDIKILPEMHRAPGVYMYHHTNIYSNDKAFLVNYGKNLDGTQVGDTVGVMRSEFGVIHFFVNGVDQGPAVSSIFSPVHGVFELWNSAVKATVVEKTRNVS